MRHQYQKQLVPYGTKEIMQMRRELAEANKFLAMLMPKTPSGTLRPQKGSRSAHHRGEERHYKTRQLPKVRKPLFIRCKSAATANTNTVNKVAEAYATAGLARCRDRKRTSSRRY